MTRHTQHAHHNLDTAIWYLAYLDDDLRAIVLDTDEANPTPARELRDLLLDVNLQLREVRHRLSRLH